MEAAPPPHLSTWGQGRTIPDPRGDVIVEGGLRVPTGKPIPRDIDSALQYNGHARPPAFYHGTHAPS